MNRNFWRFLAWLFHWTRRCQGCGRFGASRRWQHTSYVDDSLNWGTFCKSCQEEVDNYWNDMRAEYWSGRL